MFLRIVSVGLFSSTLKRISSPFGKQIINAHIFVGKKKCAFIIFSPRSLKSISPGKSESGVKCWTPANKPCSIQPVPA